MELLKACSTAPKAPPGSSELLAAATALDTSRAKGNDLFRARSYPAAVEAYSAALAGLAKGADFVWISALHRCELPYSQQKLYMFSPFWCFLK